LRSRYFPSAKATNAALCQMPALHDVPTWDHATAHDRCRQQRTKPRTLPRYPGGGPAASMDAMRPCRRPHGFTLIEQIATLAVTAILAAIAIPSMARMIHRSATRATEDALFTAARLARTQAIMQGTHVLLCPTRDGLHCSGPMDWQQGWLVAADTDHDHQP